MLGKHWCVVVCLSGSIRWHNDIRSHPCSLDASRNVCMCMCARLTLSILGAHFIVSSDANLWFVAVYVACIAFIIIIVMTMMIVVVVVVSTTNTANMHHDFCFHCNNSNRNSFLFIGFSFLDCAHSLKLAFLSFSMMGFYWNLSRI